MVSTAEDQKAKCEVSWIDRSCEGDSVTFDLDQKQGATPLPSCNSNLVILLLRFQAAHKFFFAYSCHSVARLNLGSFRTRNGTSNDMSLFRQGMDQKLLLLGIFARGVTDSGSTSIVQWKGLML